jgi:hypothetical protein
MQKQNINRAEQLWKNWEERQKGLESLVGSNSESSIIIQKLKYDFLRRGIYRLNTKSLEKEELYLHVIRSVVAKLEKMLYPNLILRTLHKLKELVYDKPRYLKNFEQQKIENIGKLTSQFSIYGFSSFTKKLDNYLDYERMEINIPMTTQLIDNSSMDLNLKLERDHSGNYQYREYEASLFKHGELQRSYIFSAANEITAIEAANLLQGRAVFKNCHTANSQISKKWMQLDFNRNEPKLLEYHEDYGYNLKNELMKIATALGLERLNVEDTLKNMEKGNIIDLELPYTGKYYLHANPSNHSIDFFNADRRIIELSKLVDEVKENKIKIVFPEIKMPKEQGKHQIQSHSLVIS